GPAGDAVIHAGRVLADEVVEENALQSHRNLPGEKRILRRRKIAETACKRFYRIETVVTRPVGEPLVSGHVLRTRAGGDFTPVKNLAAEPRRIRPRPPRRLLRKKTNLPDCAVRVAYRELVGKFAQLRECARRALRIEPGCAEEAFIPVQRGDRRRAGNAPDVAAVFDEIGENRHVTREPLLRRYAIFADEIVERRERVAIGKGIEITRPNSRDVRRITARGCEQRFAINLRDVEVFDDDPVLRAVE